MRIFNIYNPHPIIYSGDKIKNATGGTYNACGRGEVHIGFCWRKLSEWTIKINTQERGWKRLG